MLIFALLWGALVFATVICDDDNHFNKPLTIATSPAIWNLLETNAHVINAAGNAITLPELNEKKGVRQYLTWSGRVEHLSLSKSNASFQEYKNGVHLKMSAQYRGNMKARVKAFFVPEATDVIIVKSESAIVDVILDWNDYTFTPNVSVNSNVSVDFDNKLWRFGFLTSMIQEMVTSKVNGEIQRMVEGVVEQQLNPLLQKLKQKMFSRNYTNYDIEWKVHDNQLRVAIKPKSWKGFVVYKEPSVSMLCLAGMMPLMENNRNLMQSTSVTNGSAFTCVAPKFDCRQSSCSVCADLDLVLLSNSTEVQLCESRSNYISEPLTLTISPKLWNLLDTKAHLINRAVASIKIPDIHGKQGLNRYRVWGTTVQYFTVPKSGVSFQDFQKGIRLTVNVNFGIATNLVLRAWIIPFYASVRAWSEHASLDIKLVWNDFKLIPYVSMHSSVHIHINHGLLNLMRRKVENAVASSLNSEVPRKVAEAIERHVNPRLQKLKEELISKNYTDYDIDWKVQYNSARVAVKPKSWNAIDTPVKQVNDMVCIDVNVLAVLGEASKLMKKAANDSSTTTTTYSPNMNDSSTVTTTYSPNMAANGFDFTCVNPKFNCEGSSCSLCADIDFDLALMSSADKFYNCLPES
ncbi:hypothetical protein Y032_0248g89 [Ancylostoma ceylanicum]|uniref:LBP / BPI / CETP family protein n=1 Tax=Ancylostoma ceylanicum TaxID=53326 RepID=A0A016SDF7_9BILA|nr:hypothetical protein Y032_0248g89 [Ancylostoma ceylanicum]